MSSPQTILVCRNAVEVLAYLGTRGFPIRINLVSEVLEAFPIELHCGRGAALRLAASWEECDAILFRGPMVLGTQNGLDHPLTHWTLALFHLAAIGLVQLGQLGKLGNRQFVDNLDHTGGTFNQGVAGPNPARLISLPGNFPAPVPRT